MGRGKKKKRRTQHEDGIEMDEGNQPKQDSGTNKDSAGTERDVSGACKNGADRTNEPKNGIDDNDDRHEDLSSTPDDVIIHSHYLEDDELPEGNNQEDRLSRDLGVDGLGAN